jgi:rhodanese-related sulfurtransferase
MVYKNIKKEEFLELMKNENAIVIDNRTEEEYDTGHIEGAILIDYHSFDFEEKIDELDKEKIYLVYCRSGRRSESAMNLMKEYGFREVYNLQGGIIAFNK